MAIFLFTPKINTIILTFGTQSQGGMISILIPIYNYDVTKLVIDLVDQCDHIGEPYEIICFDDASDPTFKPLNQNLHKVANVSYKEMEINQGRAKIRNLLAKAAQYDYLLFMDCDSAVVDSNYIQNYIAALHTDRVLYGGRCYSDSPPTSSEWYFHWKYGRYREQSTNAQRMHQPYHSFMTNNFLMPKALFMPIQFDETLVQYGHEDTLFGMELKQRGIPIVHLNNPLRHEGLESVDVFLDKTKKGIENLHFLSMQYPYIESKLLNTFKRLKAWKLEGVTGALLHLLSPIIVKQLKSKDPKLFYFDLFKLELLIQVAQQLALAKNK